MNNLVREKLKEILTRLGTDIYQTPSTLKGALKDLASGQKVEINALVLAAGERVPHDLLLSSTVPIQVTIARLTRKMQDSYGMTEETSRWAVESWALVLERITEAELQTLSTSRNNPIPVTPSPPQNLQARPTAAPSPPKPAVNGFVEDLGKGILLKMVKIPGGSFAMGSPDGASTYKTETPLHRVNVREFYMGKYPITQAQYEAITKNNPSEFKGADRPVEKVNWQDAKSFCNYLNVYTGKNYRLPSEAEWEYACRAGSRDLYCFGDDATLLKEYAWYGDNSGISQLNSQQIWETDRDSYVGRLIKNQCQTHPVGKKRANAWGLHDMHGNVLEWCEDVWHENYQGAPSDGSAWTTGGDQSSRLLRGGGWFNSSYNCRVASRAKSNAESRDRNYGYRVVCVLQ